jgi:hypothetical protein
MKITKSELKHMIQQCLVEEGVQGVKTNNNYGTIRNQKAEKNDKHNIVGMKAWIREAKKEIDDNAKWIKKSTDKLASMGKGPFANMTKTAIANGEKRQVTFLAELAKAEKLLADAKKDWAKKK